MANQTVAQTPVRYFMEWAGTSHNPATESLAQGRYRGARKLAAAERWADVHGYYYEWGIDDLTSAEWSDEDPPYEQWYCLLRDQHGTVCASLSGIDFGRDGTPYGDKYKRVVEAELALEQMP